MLQKMAVLLWKNGIKPRVSREKEAHLHLVEGMRHYLLGQALARLEGLEQYLESLGGGGGW